MRSCGAPMLFGVVVLCSSASSAQIPALKSAPATADERIALYERWVSAEPANIGNQTLLAGAYSQKTRETTDYRYLDRASKIGERVLAQTRDYEAFPLRNLSYHNTQ